jgi:hypothetical protein
MTNHMNISHFNHLVQAAKQQDQPQRLLLVFANSELPEDCSAEQQAQFLAGSGGALAAVMCVDKSPAEIVNFATMKQEAAQFDMPWSLVFASSMPDFDLQEPYSKDVEAALQRMVESIKQGNLANMIAFDLNGDAIALTQTNKFADAP